MATTLNPVPGIASGAADSGTPDASAQNPLLVPDFYTPVSTGGAMARLSPNQMLGSAPYKRTAATATVTLGGTWANGDTATITFTNGVFASYGNPRTITVTAPSGATPSSVADQLVAAIEADPVLASFGVQASNVAGVITLSQLGPVGNFTNIGVSKVSASGTITDSASVLSGGAGAAWPFSNISYTFNGQTFWFKSRTPVVIPTPVLTAMVRDGQPVA
jgi:hypothetical protein